jgi:hypothetical protein
LTGFGLCGDGYRLPLRELTLREPIGGIETFLVCLEKQSYGYPLWIDVEIMAARFV